MQNLISELNRLYLPPGAAGDAALADVLARRIQGQSGVAVPLAADGQTRAIAIPFRPVAGGLEAQHWTQLCDVANALQTELGLPAPAVSIAGDSGYGLWLSLAAPVPETLADQFAKELWAKYLPDTPAPNGAALELPPCLHHSTGKWAAFINPGLGASFAEESGLEMRPPSAGQAALLDGLRSISEAEFAQALTQLRPAPPAIPAAASAPPAPAVIKEGLLLQDATLEDIIALLHSRNIEPTFRHLLKSL